MATFNDYYSIVDIPGWETLSIDTAERTSVDTRLELLAHETIPHDIPLAAAAPFRLAMLESLTRIVEQARSAGAVLLCVPKRRIGEPAVPTSYIVSEWRDTDVEQVEPAVFLEALASKATGTTSLVDLDGQPALREEDIERADLTDLLSLHSVRRVTYTVSSPVDPRKWLLFTFTTIGSGTPCGPLADALVRLFDAQLETLRWNEG